MTVAVEDPELEEEFEEEFDSLWHTTVSTFRIDGLGGGPSVSVSDSPPSPAPSSLSSKSKILAKFKATFGDFAKRFGIGVARGSPVAVSTTPFMAESG